MSGWRSALRHEPIGPLLESGDPAIAFFVKCDLLEHRRENPEPLWGLPEAKRIVKGQLSDGAWPYPGGSSKVRSAENYNQIETFRQLGYLVEMFGFNNENPAINRAANYLFSFQTTEGDIRGILGNQYSPYYTAAMLELLVKAGYESDRRVIKAFEWLGDIRQSDGGWAIPLRTLGKTLNVIAMATPTLEPDKSKPFSALVTGIVLRAYSAHPVYRKSKEATQAGQLLLSSLFKADKYPDRKSADYWLKFTFPFWFTDLISAMDSLSRLEFSQTDPQMQRAIGWFADNQSPDGLWKLRVLKNLHQSNELWLSLAICRIFKRLFG